MDGLKRFIQNIRSLGLEFYSRYYGVYRGVVVDNEDPDMRGRLIIKVPGIWGDDIHEKWVFGKGLYAGSDIGFFALPNKGDGIWVSFENGDPKYPVWEYGWWGKDDLPETVKRNYPNTQVWQSGKNRVELDETEGLFRVVNAGGVVFEVNENGISLGSESASSHKAAYGDTTSEILSELMQLLIDAKVLTMIGPQPLLTAPAIASLKEMVSTLVSDKVTLD